MDELEEAVRVLREGGVAAIPTDTLYGLAADALNADAIERVFAIKERPEGMALPVLLADLEQLAQWAATCLNRCVCWEEGTGPASYAG